MPRVSIWIGKEKRVVDVPDPVPEYVYMEDPLPPLCACDPRKPDYNATFKTRCFKVRPMHNTRTGERWYEGTLVE